MSLRTPLLPWARRCRYLPLVGQLTPNDEGLGSCPICGAWMKVTRRGTLRPHMDYRKPQAVNTERAS